MAAVVTLETALRNAIATAVQVAIDISTASPLVGGTARFMTSASPMVEVARVSFSRPSFGSPSTGVITMANAPKSDTDADGGVMAFMTIHDGDGTKLLTANVATADAAVNFSAGVSVTSGDTVQLTSLTITCPAS